MLSARAQSSKDMERKLVGKGEDRVIVARAIVRLIAKGFLDDRVYAENKARASLARARSTRRASAELARKGVDPATASVALEAAMREGGHSEKSLAIEAASKKIRSLARYEGRERTQRLWSWLARQGFSPEAIRAALSSMALAASELETETDE
ncbi:MAG: regulatory protein RecX [Deltaproteobacteria bacterium]|nr:regulatory protein RecX [Deltaproteobacteria bacterium]